MKDTLRLAILFLFSSICVALAQEAPNPTSSPGLAPTASPSEMQTPSPTMMVVRSVRLSFVPPPMEGTISLGIFDANKKLVRILCREAKIDRFAIEETSLTTTWDGKNDAGEDLPPGKYHARGYSVDRHLTVSDEGVASNSPPRDASDHISVKLVMNPLLADVRSVVDLGVGFDADSTFLKTMDGLPLRTISSTPHIVHILIAKKGEMDADVWQDNGTKIEQFRLTGIHAMMAFDCGDLELK